MTAKKTIILINPNLVLQRNDLFTTGIVYLPISLAYLAAALREKGYDSKTIDTFGEDPNKIRADGNFLLRGLTESEIVGRIPEHAYIFFIYAINLTHHISVIRIVKRLKSSYPKTPVVILENSQAVTGYSLSVIQDELFHVGVDFFVTGEAEINGPQLCSELFEGRDGSGIDGIGFRSAYGFEYWPSKEFIEDLDSLPFPAWDQFPLRNYWRLKYAHGPFETRRYLPLLTSRGCPYRCNFCAIPKMNNRRWRARSAKNVVDEMEKFLHGFGVHEFHIEDVDPTVEDKRIREICGEIISRKLDVIWKISSGTKVETILHEETIQVMAKAGCRYISISPETGSAKILKKMNKPFNLDHAVRMVKEMNKVGIFSQACFVLGYPGETDADREMTRKLVHDLARVGIDEIALFIITPVPGSEILGQFSGYKDYSQLNFSPTWRADYEIINKFRFNLYRSFLLWKFLSHPRKILWQLANFLRRNFKTKMEMTPYRALHTAIRYLRLKGRRFKIEN